MTVHFFCSTWGLPQDKMEGNLQKIKDVGYDGVEFGFALDDPRTDEFIGCAKKYSLQLIGQQYAAAGNNFSAYKRSFIAHLYFLASFGPLFINSHTGKDYYSTEQNGKLITEAKKVEKETGIRVLHETHRGRFPFCAQAAMRYANDFPDIRYTADFSHFCAVSESYLQDQKAALRVVIKRSEHIHARVGHPQGPQVTDPRLPEWKEALDHHLKWWDAIIGYHRSAGTKTFTITPEFGPAPYMFSLPGTKVPAADQWEINRHMMKLLKNRYTQII